MSVEDHRSLSPHAKSLKKHAIENVSTLVLKALGGEDRNNIKLVIYTEKLTT
jgi:hypothetical protein